MSAKILQFPKRQQFAIVVERESDAGGWYVIRVAAMLAARQRVACLRGSSRTRPARRRQRCGAVMTLATTTTAPAAATPVLHGPGLPVSGQVRLFFKLLDPGAKRFTFQTFQDKKPITRPELAKVTKDKRLLLQLHAHGAGIYITVNETEARAL